MAFSIEYAYNFYIYILYNKYVYHVIPYIYMLYNTITLCNHIIVIILLDHFILWWTGGLCFM